MRAGPAASSLLLTLILLAGCGPGTDDEPVRVPSQWTTSPFALE